MSVTVEFKALPHFEGLALPAYETDLAAGADLRAAVPTEAPMVLEPGARALVPTGLAMAESERLVRQLARDGVEVNNLIINQIIPDSGAQDYVSRIAREQDKCIEELRAAGASKKIAAGAERRHDQMTSSF